MALALAAATLGTAVLEATSLDAPRTAAAQGQGASRLYLPLVQTPRTPHVAAVVTSRPRGLYDAPIEVALHSPSEGATIRYTTDGSTPGPDRGAVYRAPLTLERPTVLRTAAYRRGWIASPVGTWSYLFPAAVAAQPAQPPDWPSSWGHYAESHLEGESVPADYGVDTRVSRDPRYAAEWSAGLRVLPTLSLAVAPQALFGPHTGIYIHPTERGADWERPVSAEWLPPPGAGEPAFQIEGGLRVAGNASRKHVSTPKKSFSLRFRKRYGAAKLEHPLFPGSRVARFDVLRLRAIFNDSYLYLPESPQYLRDRWARQTQAAMGELAAHGRFAHVYLNGLYWGLYDITEEPTASFMVEHRGGDEPDWDVVKPTAGGEDGIEDGDRRAFEALLAARDVPGEAGLREMRRLLEVDAYIDYTLLQMFVGNAEFGDNWRAARRKDAPDGSGFVFFAWDFENVLDLLPSHHRFYDAKTSRDVADTYGIGGLHGRLRQDLEYRQRFADHAQRHLAPGGALSATAAVARYRALAEHIAPAIVAESARWGDHPPSPLAITHGEEVWRRFWSVAGAGRSPDRDQQWWPEVERVTAFLASRPATLRAQLCREGLYPDVIAPTIRAAVPQSPAPGPAGPRVPREVIVEPGDPALACPGARAAVIWYTLNGRDPRRPGGGFEPSARPVHGPIQLPRGTGLVRLRARARLDTTWSAMAEASYGLPRLSIDEIHYHPAGDQDGSHEFLEIRNHEDVALDLAGWRLRGIGLRLPSGSHIEPEGRLVFARDPEALRVSAGLERAPLGYPGALSNGGETLAIEAPDGQVVFRVAYDDAGAWPRAADGHGASLVRRPGAALAQADDPETWRGSRTAGGSPGRPDPPQPPLVVVNELLAGADPRQRAIELHNLGTDSVALDGWGLGTDLAAGPRFVLPAGTRLAAGARRVIAEHALSGLADGTGLEAGANAADAPQLLAPQGATILLFPRDGDAYTGDVRGVDYGPHDAPLSWGRHRSSAGVHFVPLAQPTLGRSPEPGEDRAAQAPGAPNAQPWVGQVVLAELMVKPSAAGREASDEYIELFNRGDDTVALASGPSGDGGAWAFIRGVTLRFPPGAILPPRGRLLVTGDEPRAFRARHDVPRSVPVIGPWQGRLDDQGERITLARPVPGADPKASFDDRSAWIEVESLRYGTRPPWPAALTDGSGAALERVSPERFAGDPAAWSALAEGGSPGRPNRPLRRVWLPWLDARRR